MKARSAFLFLLAPLIQTQAFQTPLPWIHRGGTASSSSPSSAPTATGRHHHFRQSLPLSSPPSAYNTHSLKSSSSSENTTPTTPDPSSTPPTPSSTPPTTLSSKAQTILTSIHESKLPFRIIVIGPDSILETTSPLGPHVSLSISPKTNEPLMSFASDDRSFEFHVKIDRVCKVTFVALEKKTKDGDGEDGGEGEDAKRVMRVCRFLNEKGSLICSLILADEGGEEGEKWFRGMIDAYGDEVLM
ncbi:hypothetical protein ACHAXS_004649 [Conticribra weissflogii]